jgi:hypothetical protein
MYEPVAAKHCTLLVPPTTLIRVCACSSGPLVVLVCLVSSFPSPSVETSELLGENICMKMNYDNPSVWRLEIPRSIRNANEMRKSWSYRWKSIMEVGGQAEIDDYYGTIP